MEKRCCGCMRLKTQSPLCEHCGYNENIDNLPHQLSLNTVLNERYQIGKVVGQGGFGITYIGWDQKLSVPVAIKEYYPNGVVDRDVEGSKAVICKDVAGKAFFQNNRDRFLYEARTLTKFSGVPQIVHVLNIFEENNTVYIAMEYIRGIDLRKQIRMQGILSVEETFRILRPVMGVLARVHSTGLIHRDISPDNIMLLPDGQSKILDFGAAGRINGEADAYEPPKATEAILKQGFAPPEQYQRNGNMGPWTDLYALCATIHYCLTGKIPMAAPKRQEQENEKIGWDKIPGLTPDQAAALEKGMALSPEDRFPDMQGLYAALFPESPNLPMPDLEPRSEVRTQVSGKTQVSQKPSRPPKPRKKPLTPAAKGGIALGVLCLCIAAAVMYVLSLPSGWKTEVGGKAYYTMGKRAVGWKQIENNTYYFDESGLLQTDWQQIGGEQYYFGDEGILQTGTIRMDDMEYRFAETGAFLHRSWQYTPEQLRSIPSEENETFLGSNGKKQRNEYQILRAPVTSCSQLTVELEISDYKNGDISQWAFFYRDMEGIWHQAGDFFGLENDKARQTYTFETPVSFDAYACVCMSRSNFWNFTVQSDLSEAIATEYEI